MTRQSRPGAARAAVVLAAAAFVLARAGAVGAVSSPEPWRPPGGGAGITPAPALPAPAFGDTLPRADRTYRFEDYPGEPWAGGKPAAVDFVTNPRSREVKGMLLGVNRTGANFAGPYALLTGGCGRECLHFVVADARSGRVWVPDFRARVGYEFRKDSRLLVVDPRPSIEAALRVSPQIGAMWTRWYVWTGAGFAAVDSARVDAPGGRGMR